MMTETEASAQGLKWADSLAAKTSQFTPPIDLIKIARLVGVKRMRLQLMIPRAAIIAIDGGYEIYLRELEEKDIDISGPEPLDLLSPRQRFTLAHEIAHTRFYARLKTKPILNPVRAFKDERDLEEFCNKAAGRILVPTTMLKHHIERSIGDVELIDATFLSATTKLFRTSPEVLLERLRKVETANIFSRCILFARRTSEEDALIMASYFGDSLLSKLPEPEDRTSLAKWLRGFPLELIREDRILELKAQVAGIPITLRKVPWGSGGAFFLQVDG